MGFFQNLFGKQPPTNDVPYQEILNGVIQVEKALYAKYKSNHVEHYIVILAAGVRFYTEDRDVSRMVQYAVSKAKEKIANPVVSAPIAERINRYEDMTRDAIRMLSDYRKRINITEQRLYEGITLYCDGAGKRLRKITESAELRSPAKAIYERVMGKYRLSEPEEYFAVVGVIEFLTKTPTVAMDTLFERINRFHDETGILVGGLGASNYEYPFKELLEEYQKAMSKNEVTLKDVMLYLAGLEKTLEKLARKTTGK